MIFNRMVNKLKNKFVFSKIQFNFQKLVFFSFKSSIIYRKVIYYYLCEKRA